MHLKADELVDVAEGTRAEASLPHLAACEDCRRQLNELRAVMSMVADVGVPEPSPLFWDHLSRRVNEAVPHDGFGVRGSGFRVLHSGFKVLGSAAAWRRVVFPAWAVVLSVLIVVISLKSPAPAPGGKRTDAPAAIDVGADPAVDARVDHLDEDASLMLVATLAEHMDLDAAGDAGLARSDSAEHAVTHMNDEELRELRRLLKEEMGRPGA